MNKQATALGLIVGLLIGVSGTIAYRPIGRFQIDRNEHHVFILDTATGQVWEKFVPDNEGLTSEGFGNRKL